jgi:hypothetical protein
MRTEPKENHVTKSMTSTRIQINMATALSIWVLNMADTVRSLKF